MSVLSAGAASADVKTRCGRREERKNNSNWRKEGMKEKKTKKYLCNRERGKYKK
jgi:hypothetical protein